VPFPPFPLCSEATFLNPARTAGPRNAAHQASPAKTNAMQYMHTWILKDEDATYIAPIKQKKMHLINTMSVCDIIWRRVGDTRINRTSIWSKERNRFSLV